MTDNPRDSKEIAGAMTEKPRNPRIYAWIPWETSRAMTEHPSNSADSFGATTSLKQ